MIAAPMPFTEVDALNDSALRSVLRLYYDQAVHGRTGQRNHRRMILTSARSRGRGARHQDPGRDRLHHLHAVVALGLHAREVVVDCLLSTPPPYAAPTPREIIAIFSAISDNVDLPIMVYNWARGVAVKITWETAIELARSAALLRSKIAR